MYVGYKKNPRSGFAFFGVFGAQLETNRADFLNFGRFSGFVRAPQPGYGVVGGCGDRGRRTASGLPAGNHRTGRVRV